jgi:hypothetical protein
MLCSDDLRLLAYSFPDSERSGIHEQQAELSRAFVSLAVDADYSQQLGLAGTDQVWPHAESGRILNLPDLRRTLSDRLIVRRPPCVVSIETGQQIIRRIGG